MNHPDSVNHCPNCGAALPGANAAAGFKMSGASQSAANQPAANIESHMVKAIISAICCCLPIGIAAIVFAAKVGPSLKANNCEAALEASKKANLWGNVSIGVGLVTQIFWIIFYQLVSKHS